ncbi:MAG: sugar phosphate isomerase/epimerase, partial [Verrucomicrobia bacterium]|nr:sugar phosphate isomerase/epimerase [Verrucomicrobiota bacterium]
VSTPVLGALTKPVRDPSDGLKLGITTYTLRQFTLDRAIAMIQQAGVKYVSLKDMHLPLNSSPEERQEARRKLEAAGLVLMGGGVIYLKNDQAQIRQAFDYARDAGMPTIICSPEPEALDTVERFARQYQIRIAIHNHGPGDRRYPSPYDVWRMVKDRDPLLGLCLDVGHTVRIGVDPVPAIRHCARRLYDFHMKDESKAAPNGQPVPVGRGVIDIVGVLRALLHIRYGYDVELEYEAHADAPLPGMIESYAYIRGILATV